MKRQKRCSSEQDKNSSISVNTFQLGNTTVPLSDAVKSLGILLDSTLSMENFISQTAKSWYHQLHRISSVQKYLSFHWGHSETGHLTHSVTPSNSLHSGLPASSVQSLHCIHICAACLILNFFLNWPHQTCFNFSTGFQSKKEFSTR